MFRVALIHTAVISIPGSEMGMVKALNPQRISSSDSRASAALFQGSMSMWEPGFPVAFPWINRDAVRSVL